MYIYVYLFVCVSVFVCLCWSSACTGDVRVNKAWEMPYFLILLVYDLLQRNESITERDITAALMVLSRHPSTSLYFSSAIHLMVDISGYLSLSFSCSCSRVTKCNIYLLFRGNRKWMTKIGRGGEWRDGGLNQRGNVRARYWVRLRVSY